MGASERVAKVSSAIDRVFGSRVLVTPMTGRGGYLVPGPDPDAPAYEARGVLARTTALARRTGSGAQGGSNAEFRGMTYRVSLNPGSFGANPPPKRGDLIQMVDEPGAPRGASRAIEPAEFGHGRLIVHLVEVKAR